MRARRRERGTGSCEVGEGKRTGGGEVPGANLGLDGQGPDDIDTDFEGALGGPPTGTLEVLGQLACKEAVGDEAGAGEGGGTEGHQGG